MERRRISRIKVYLPVECIIHTANGEKTINATSEDLSTSGIKIFSEEYLPVKTEVDLNINLVTHNVKINAQVIWCRKIKESDSFIAGLSFPEEQTLFTNLHQTIFISPEKNVVSQPMLKRAIDFILSVCILFVASPIILLTCIFIKLDSGGPVFYRQWRAGASGKRFIFYKFRSMYKNAPHIVHKEYAKKLIVDSQRFGWIQNKEVYKLIKDSRITSFGHIIRKLSIDELPQFFNVIKGDMSIVGPRPPILYEMEFYSARERKRLKVKPGITGLWQVSGRSSVTFSQMIDLDIEYIENWSFWLDIKIILKTFLAVFRFSEAY